MRGLNKLTLNQATVCEAIQEYLEKRTVNIKMDVTNVSELCGNDAGQFRVIVKENTDIIPFETKPA